MTTRTSESTVTFSHPFSVGAMDHPQPAGTYGSCQTMRRYLICRCSCIGASRAFCTRRQLA